MKEETFEKYAQRLLFLFVAIEIIAVPVFGILKLFKASDVLNIACGIFLGIASCIFILLAILFLISVYNETWKNKI
jgi:hypothetical protein